MRVSASGAMLLLAGLSMAGVAAVGRAAVDQNVDVPFSDVVNNPCTGEDVVVTGTQHIVGHTTQPQPGVFNVGLHTNTSGTGVAAVSGASYQFSSVDNFHEKLTEPGGSFSFTDSSDLVLISQGGADNFVVHVIQHVTMNANGEITSVVLETNGGCKG